MIAKNKRIKKDGRFQNIFFSVIIGIFLFGVIGFFVSSNIKINQKRTEMIGRIEELKKEIEVLEKKNEELQSGIIQTGSESYWEEKMREQGYKKPGEEAVVVLPPEEQQEESAGEEKNFWEKIFDPVKNFFK